jgi:hypothetical protein
MSIPALVNLTKLVYALYLYVCNYMKLEHNLFSAHGKNVTLCVHAHAMSSSLYKIAYIDLVHSLQVMN